MLHIDPNTIIGQCFVTQIDANTQFLCIGYGQDPTSAANYVVGEHWDQASNRTSIKTFLFKEVKFMGKIGLPAKTPVASQT